MSAAAAERSFSVAVEMMDGSAKTLRVQGKTSSEVYAAARAMPGVRRVGRVVEAGKGASSGPRPGEQSAEHTARHARHDREPASGSANAAANGSANGSADLGLSVDSIRGPRVVRAARPSGGGTAVQAPQGDAGPSGPSASPGAAPQSRRAGTRARRPCRRPGCERSSRAQEQASGDQSQGQSARRSGRRSRSLGPARLPHRQKPSQRRLALSTPARRLGRARRSPGVRLRMGKRLRRPPQGRKAPRLARSHGTRHRRAGTSWLNDRTHDVAAGVRQWAFGSGRSTERAAAVTA